VPFHKFPKHTRVGANLVFAPFVLPQRSQKAQRFLPRRHKDTKILVIGHYSLGFVSASSAVKGLTTKTQRHEDFGHWSLFIGICLCVFCGEKRFTAESAESAEEMMTHGLDLSGLSSVESAEADFLVSAREFHSLATSEAKPRGLMELGRFFAATRLRMTMGEEELSRLAWAADCGPPGAASRSAWTTVHAPPGAGMCRGEPCVRPRVPSTNRERINESPSPQPSPWRDLSPHPPFVGANPP
jgi:hypothetical protein